MGADTSKLYFFPLLFTSCVPFTCNLGSLDAADTGTQNAHKNTIAITTETYFFPFFSSIKNPTSINLQPFVF